MPESFKVLIKELQSLSLDIKVLDSEGHEIDLKQNIDGDDGVPLQKYQANHAAFNEDGEDGVAAADDDDLLPDDDKDDEDDDFDDFDDEDEDDEEDEDEDDDDFDLNEFFNEINPTINDAGYGAGFVPDTDE